MQILLKRYVDAVWNSPGIRSPGSGGGIDVDPSLTSNHMSNATIPWLRTTAPDT